MLEKTEFAPVPADLISSCDPVLHAFLVAEGSGTTEEALRLLVEEEAVPVIVRVAERKGIGDADVDHEEIISAAREQVIKQLLAFRSGDRTKPILQFRNYVARVAYASWVERLRSEKPRFSMLINRVRYLLENRTVRQSFALWEGKSGEEWCGLKGARGRHSEVSPRGQFLIVDPKAAAREIFGRSGWQHLGLARLVERVLGWVGCALEFRDLVGITAELLQISDRTEALDPTNELRIDDQLTEALSPREEAAWNEYLRWLWNEIGHLPARQSAAFLLNSNVLRDFELLGVASIRSLAPRFEMDPEHLAVLWQRLPLDDNAIAAELNCTRQQVINLRRVARDQLGRAWREFPAAGDATGNKVMPFPSSDMRP